MIKIGAMRYTKESGCLTLSQRIFYEKNGYIVFPGLIKQNILDKCRQRFYDIVDGKASRDGIIVMYDIKDKKSVNKIQEIHHDRIFREYMEHKKILDIVECVTGPNILAVHSMLIAKPPDIGFGSSRHPPHQDLYYFPFRPAEKIVAAWTAMEPCDSENGCLYVAPGSHALNRLLPHDYPPESEGAINKFYHGIQNLPSSIEWVNLEMQPGDTVFFHPLLFHGSGVNNSNRTRLSISCHYASTDCILNEDHVPDTIKNEILALMKKKYPSMDITYTDIWHYKSSLIRGLRSSF